MIELLPEPLRPFVQLSYPTALRGRHGETLYGKGPKDVCFVFFYAMFFSVLRYVMMHYVLGPFARIAIPTPPLEGSKNDSPAMKRHHIRVAAKKKEHNVVRFAEQAWSLGYCTVFWSLGMIILWRIPDRLSPEQLWGTYPLSPLPGLTKFYYMTQLGWWFSQLYVINTEKRRKDHWQMFGHHILSIALISCSYAGNYTRIGVVVHALMDLCDILLPLAKCLRYMGFTTACDAAFVVFLLAWSATRQVGLFLVIRSAWVEAPKHIGYKWAPETGHFFTSNILTGFVVLLSILLVLCTIWFYMAVMVAVRVVRGEGAEDTRSDDEDCEDEISVDDDSGSHTNGYFSNTPSGRATPNGVATPNGRGTPSPWGTPGASGRATPNGSSPRHLNGSASAVSNGASKLKQRK